MAVVRALQRTLPHEDVLLLVDHAFAPYARRPRRVTSVRVRRLVGALADAGAKAVVLASRTATLDHDPGTPDVPVPVIGLEPALARAVARPGVGGAALVAGVDCLRSPTLLSELRRAGGRVRPVTADLWPGLSALVEAGPAAEADLRRLVDRRVAQLVEGGTGVIALGCVHAAAVAPLVSAAAGGRLEIVDSALLTVGRTRGVLAQQGLLVRRRRPGWCRVMSSQPTAARAWPRPTPRTAGGPALASDPAGD
jgi:glutamate racemase